MTEAADNKGIAELLIEIEKYRGSLKSSSRDSVIARKKVLVRFQLTDMIKSRLIEETLNYIINSFEFEESLDNIIDGIKDPYSACDELLSAKLTEGLARKEW